MFLNILNNSQFQNFEFIGNSVQTYMTAIIIFLVASFIFKIIQSLILSRLKTLAIKTKTDLDDTFIKIISAIKPALYWYLSFFIALQVISISKNLANLINSGLIIIITLQIVNIAQVFIEYLTEKHLEKSTDSNDTKSASQAIQLILQIAVWTIAVLLILANIGLDITSLIAGLGIGGVAIAFAVKDILGDLLSSFSIYFDKPFRVGDTIKVGNEVGTVEKVGIKTTRIRALQGEELVFPNQKLTSQMLNNYKKLQKRRITNKIGITYETPLKKLKKVPELIEKAISQQQEAEFSRAHFESFGDSALIFEIVYYITDSSYEIFMDTQQAINFGILESLHQEKISIAYPTQTLYLTNNTQ